MDDIQYGNFKPFDLAFKKGVWHFKPKIKLFLGNIEGCITAISCYGKIVEFHPTGLRKEWVLVADMSLITLLDTPEGT